MRRDFLEAVSNAAAGIPISLGAVAALRWLGLWDMPTLAITAVFFGLSVGRSFALRRWFR